MKQSPRAYGSLLKCQFNQRIVLTLDSQVLVARCIRLHETVNQPETAAPSFSITGPSVRYVALTADSSKPCFARCRTKNKVDARQSGEREVWARDQGAPGLRAVSKSTNDVPDQQKGIRPLRVDADGGAICPVIEVNSYWCAIHRGTQGLGMFRQGLFHWSHGL
jgi:hypothetical protein